MYNLSEVEIREKPRRKLNGTVIQGVYVTNDRFQEFDNQMSNEDSSNNENVNSVYCSARSKTHQDHTNQDSVKSSSDSSNVAIEEAIRTGNRRALCPCPTGKTVVATKFQNNVLFVKYYHDSPWYRASKRDWFESVIERSSKQRNAYYLQLASPTDLRDAITTQHVATSVRRRTNQNSGIVCRSFKITVNVSSHRPYITTTCDSFVND
ncbi:uncharacterized protein LOC141915199 [Tubulanus polymorphus]|uniref:uncharacterized protein LOC141915199 n=1 Tax=Tubulanus polymorphus TaxID=672921 RepID=UPI003DA1F0F0